MRDMARPNFGAGPFPSPLAAAVALYGSRADHIPVRSCNGCGAGPILLEDGRATYASCFPAGVLIAGERISWAKIRRAKRAISGEQLPLPL